LAINGRGSADGDGFNSKLRKGSNRRRERELRRRGGAGISLLLQCRIEGGKRREDRNRPVGVAVKEQGRGSGGEGRT
jgi:hypothetical protein